MGRFAGLYDQLSDLLAEISAAEISEPNDIDEFVRGPAVVAEDWAFLLGRVADRLEEVRALAPWIADTFDHTAGYANAAAGDLSPLADFQLVRT